MRPNELKSKYYADVQHLPGIDARSTANSYPSCHRFDKRSPYRWAHAAEGTRTNGSTPGLLWPLRIKVHCYLQRETLLNSTHISFATVSYVVNCISRQNLGFLKHWLTYIKQLYKSVIIIVLDYTSATCLNTYYCGRL